MHERHVSLALQTDTPLYGHLSPLAGCVRRALFRERIARRHCEREDMDWPSTRMRHSNAARVWCEEPRDALRIGVFV